MPLVVDDGIANTGMLVVVARQENGCAQIDGMSPPFAENGALHLEALDVFVVVRHGHGRNHLVGDEPNRRAARRIPADLLRISVEIARRSLPVLSLPLV